MADEYKLTYFNYRGIAEPIRLIFKYADVPFEDVRLEWDDEWNQSKKYQFPWASLPVLEIGDLKLSQSAAIGRFLAKKFCLNGGDEFDAAKCDELVGTLMDLRTEWNSVFMALNPGDKQALKEKFISHLKSHLGVFSNFLKSNGGTWFVGNSLTWADLYIAYYLDFFKQNMELESEDILKEFPDLQKFRNEIFAIPKLKEWLDVRPKTDF